MNQQVTTLFLLDNVDSFTYNLVDELRTLNLDIKVYRNTVSANALFERMHSSYGKRCKTCSIQRIYSNKGNCYVIFIAYYPKVVLSNLRNNRAFRSYETVLSEKEVEHV